MTIDSDGLRCARAEIQRFIALLYASIDAQVEVARVGNDVHEIAAYARTGGFGFTGEELDGFIDEQIETRLDAGQREARAAAFESTRTGPMFSDRMHPTRVETHDAAMPFALDRTPLFAGELAIISGSAAFAAVAERMRAALAATFGADDPTTSAAGLAEKDFHARVEEVDRNLAADDELPRRLAEFVRSLGWPPGSVGYFGPFLRYNLPPVDAGTQGYFSKVPVRYTSRHVAPDGACAVLNAHRDTWFGAPFHQVNVWAPLYPYPRGSGLVLLPGLFSRSLRNNTAGFDVWRAQLGLAVGPMCLEEVDVTERLAVDLDVGEFIAFSANHYHGTGPNPGPISRISMELRLVCDADRHSGMRSPNVDFHGVGELSQFRRLPA